MYWILNKITEKAGIAGNIPGLAAYTGIRINSLYYHFSRKKEKELNTDNYRIVKEKKQ